MDAKLEALRIVTRCTSRDQFVSTFRRFCSPTSCFIPSPDTRPIGTGTTFSIRLADGTQVLRGQGVVLDSWTTANNPFKRAGVHLGIHRLYDDSAALYQQLLEDKSLAVRIPPAAQLRMIHETVPMIAAQLETPTIEMPPLPLPEEPRVPGSDFILPANPLTEMTDDLVAAFVECNLTSEDLDATPGDLHAINEVQPAVMPRAVTEVPMAAVADVAVPPADSPVVITDAVPVEAPFDPTIPNHPLAIPSRAICDSIPADPPSTPHRRDLVATISDPPHAPSRDLIATISEPHATTPHSRDLIATILGMAPLQAPRIYAAPEPVITEFVDRVSVPVRSRVVEITTMVAPMPAPVAVRIARPSSLRRIVRAFAARLRRWWIPATVAATLVVGVITLV